jgi:hypothetical protein
VSPTTAKRTRKASARPVGSSSRRRAPSAVRERHVHLVAGALEARRGEQVVERLADARRRLGRERAADQPVGRQPEERAGRGVGVHHLARRGVDHEHRLARALEQQAVAGLDVAQPPVVALERLLRLDEALLQGGHGAQVAPDQDHGAVVQADARVRHGQIGPVERRVVDLAAWGRAAGAGGAAGGLAQQLLHLAAGFGVTTSASRRPIQPSSRAA